MSLYNLVDELNALVKSEPELFGGGRLVSVKNSSDDDKGPQFASDLSFLVVELKNDDGTIRKNRIVVKKQVADDFRELYDTDTQFLNEVNMYNTILPRLGVSALKAIPHCFYANATDGKRPKEDILILEDLREYGFKIPTDIFLDFEHISKALTMLGQFHGLSYKLKKTSPDDFYDLGHLLRGATRKTEEMEACLFKYSVIRAFEPMVKEYPDDDVVRRTYERLSERTLMGEWERLKRPEEPFTVITHGDYNRNNLLYQYDSKGAITDLKCYDFGTPLLSNPTADVAFFLYLNTDQQMRIKHWDEFLNIYWSALTSIAPEPGFTFEEFLEHFKKRAILGFCRASFFIPFMLHGKDEDFFSKTIEERREMALTIGGEKGTEVTVNILRHVRDKGYMSAYLEDED